MLPSTSYEAKRCCKCVIFDETAMIATVEQVRKWKDAAAAAAAVITGAQTPDGAKRGNWDHAVQHDHDDEEQMRRNSHR